MKTFIGIVLALLVCSGIAVIAGTIISLAVFSLMPKEEFDKIADLEKEDDDE